MAQSDPVDMQAEPSPAALDNLVEIQDVHYSVGGRSIFAGLTLSIPRGQTAMAVGHAAPDAKSFTLEAVRGSLTNGIVSNPFLEQAFRTDRYTIKVDINADGTWSYEQDTLLIIPGQSEPFHHTDRNRLRKIGEATPNPTAIVARQTTR